MHQNPLSISFGRDWKHTWVNLTNIFRRRQLIRKSWELSSLLEHLVALAVSIILGFSMRVWLMAIWSRTSAIQMPIVILHSRESVLCNGSQNTALAPLEFSRWVNFWWVNQSAAAEHLVQDEVIHRKHWETICDIELSFTVQVSPLSCSNKSVKKTRPRCDFNTVIKP